MKADAAPLLALFEKKARLEVPLFQRQYVWSREPQWEPLWEDISRKFTERLEGRIDAPVHFLGAMVLDQKFTPSTHVERRQVIDGQQRLTTFQLFISAFRDFCREQGCVDLANEAENYTFNRGMMANPEVDRFKVWPTQLDQAQFRDALTLGSRAAVEKKHPLVKRKYARKYDSRPRMIEAYLFFHDQLTGFFLGENGDPPLLAERELATRLEEAFQTLKSALQVVVIDLDQGDDAQVIFETLNARGEPLLPADLLRNYIFLRAARQEEPQEELYQAYWSSFDEPFWRVEVRQGRLNRPRSDLFMQHFLTSRQLMDIPIKHLFVEYRFWIERNRPFQTVREELETLARQGGHFRRLADPAKDDMVAPLMRFLEIFDVGTCIPLLLMILEAEIEEAEWKAIAGDLESFIVRRAVVGSGTKNYNRLFLSVAKSMKKTGANAGNFRKILSEHGGSASGWPNDEAFIKAWQAQHAYQVLNNPKIVHILRRISESIHSAKQEPITFNGSLTVEHILPQKWTDHWPFADGSKGLSSWELYTAEAGDPRRAPTQRRNSALQTMGNLTLLTQSLNSSVSNSAWASKKEGMLDATLLPITQRLRRFETWDEDAIDKRGKELFEHALKIWAGPDQAQA
ncbi:DUF262 domain-containing protein [Luteolibacter sp. Populi]|uniref:DUF262 domain-containing protein n=1 Tax=Luteolibacter sp. Populi TaxID=3230487 RepID=UPI003467A613